LTRRVGVTGIALVSSLGLSAQATWGGLLAGRSGIARITHFDPSDFAAQIAGEVKGFDPLQYLDKKDVKKMDVFIQFAIAASQFAMDDARLSVTEDMAPRVGVFIADRKSTRLNSSHRYISRMPSSA
jgi:3-oxoacyl-[acyl-carrier-protein] synthase II